MDWLFGWFVLVALCALVPSGCAEEHTGQPPPPYHVYFADSVPELDRDVWGFAAGDWNKAMGGFDYVFWVGAEPAGDRCGVEIALIDDAPAGSQIDSCLARIEYARGGIAPCIALQELGRLLLGPRAVMESLGCDFDAVVTPDLAQRVRDRWGMP